MLLFYINVVNKQQSRIAHLDSRFSSKKIFNPISSLPFLIVKLLVLVKVQSESMSSSPTQSSTSVSPELVAATTHFDSFAPYWYTLIGRTLGRRPLRIWSPC
ncbi:uncharacterized protein LOC111831222 isoform X6 [Capsella rubella]|uniref:uncharacterized protein LOC111831222 isoform X6 n=1 Tax=Capsella rubella TaxID=81985 RepID=UPI000CD51B6B|nr:uncharacterized protein LOC111831222 isoform X6 [Capsella rubella]